jgi:hypothetical protein
MVIDRTIRTILTFSFFVVHFFHLSMSLNRFTDVMRELMISKKQGSQTDDLKREVFRLQKDLLQEKTKVKGTVFFNSSCGGE